MKKLLVSLIASLVFSGSIFAQHPETHWPGFYSPAYEMQGALYASLMVNGEPVDTDYPDWQVLEVAAFVGDELRGTGMFLTDEYLEFGELFPTLNAEPVYYTTPGEPVTFKMYNHATGVEYEVCEPVIWDGDPINILTGEEHWEGFDDPDHPLMLNFIGGTPAQTFTKDITGYGESEEGGYYLIASPITEEVTPSEENGFITSEYDLYSFDHNYVGEEWRNYEDTEFLLANGKGYLYASQVDTQITFTGTPYSGDGVVELAYSETAPNWGRWNLVGNPFPEAAGIDREDYYVLNSDGTEFIEGTGDIPAMEGVFVLAEEEGESVTFTPADKAMTSPSLALNLTQGRGVVDRAVIRFSEGRMLPKFQMNPSHTKVYIPQDGNDYAVVRAGAMGEMPVCFKAEKNGTYTLSFNSQDVCFNYLHLIDNMTGVETDLLDNPSYSFNAQTTDYASRFKLVFATGNTGEDSFAFFSNGSFVINNDGEATVQVIDVNGRILSSETINGCANVSVNAAAGVYTLRLVNGSNVKVQKVVIR